VTLDRHPRMSLAGIHHVVKRTRWAPDRGTRGRRLLTCLGVLLLAGCQTREMAAQPKQKPLTESPMFADGRASRPLVSDTVARGQLRLDPFYFEGKIDGKPAKTLPVPVTEALLRRGQERFNIFCANCHGRVGDGGGMIVQRGMKRPPSFHDKRLREVPPGYIFDVATNGFGVMYGYVDRVPVEDRWAIIAYIRALQRSQNATLADVPEEERVKLEGVKP
jgi:mono/diheme cytochrome c family protein